MPEWLGRKAEEKVTLEDYQKVIDTNEISENIPHVTTLDQAREAFQALFRSAVLRLEAHHSVGTAERSGLFFVLKKNVQGILDEPQTSAHPQAVLIWKEYLRVIEILERNLLS